MAKIPKGKTVKKACPECGGDLVIRQSRTTQQHFLGCINYPRCQYTEPLPEDVKMRAMGAKRLPGF
jgi:DNA topoisomerase-1